MRRLVPVITATILAIIVALGAAIGTNPEQAAQPIRSQADLDSLELEAEKACRCERATGKPGTCWSTYRKRTAGLNPVEMASACAPVSTEIACFMVNDKESCIVTGRNGTQLCSDAEARAFESAFNSAMQKSLRSHPDDMERASKAANAAADSAMASIRKGIVPPADPSSQGCS
jgi:hypothetical protein